MDLKFLRQIRLMGVVMLAVGWFAHNQPLMVVGYLTWGVSLLWSYSMIENMVIRNLDQIKKESEEQSDDNTER